MANLGKSAQVLTAASAVLLSTIFLGVFVETIHGEKILGRSSQGVGFSSNQTVVTEVGLPLLPLEKKRWSTQRVTK